MTETLSVDGAAGPIATLFLSFEREGFFDPELHRVLAAQSARPVIGLGRRGVLDAPGRARALDRLRDAVSSGAAPLVAAIEGTVRVGAGGIAFRLPQGQLFTGGALQDMLGSVEAPSILVLIDAAVLGEGAPSRLASLYAAALQETFVDATPAGRIAVVARAPGDSNRLAPRFARAIETLVAADRASGRATSLRLEDVIGALPGPGAQPVTALSAGADAARIPLARVAAAPATERGGPSEASIGVGDGVGFERARGGESAVGFERAGGDESADGENAAGVERAEPAPPPPSRRFPAEGASQPFERFVRGLLHHDTPRRMRAYRPYEVKVAVSRDLAGAGARGLGDGDRASVHDDEILTTTVMTVSLVGAAADFHIQPLSEDQQHIERAAGAASGPPRGVWRFLVTPQRVGAHRLSIRASCVVGDGHGAQGAIKSAVNVVPVRVTVNVGYGARGLAKWLSVGVASILVFKFGVEDSFNRWFALLRDEGVLAAFERLLP